MENIKVGDYIRTRKGYIRKVIGRDCDNHIVLDIHLEGDNYITKIEDIIKHSKDIIDLIKEGDIIKVYFPIKKITRKVYVDEYFKDSLDALMKGNIILKSILTKEQFKSVEYRMEE